MTFDRLRSACLDAAENGFSRCEDTAPSVRDRYPLHLPDRFSELPVRDPGMRHVRDDPRAIDTRASRKVQAQQPVIIHGASVIWIEQPYPLEARTPGQHTGMPDRRHPAADRALIVGIADAAEKWFVCFIEDQITEGEIAAVAFQCGDRLFDLTRREPIVGIENGNEAAARHGDALVEGIADPAILLDHPVVLRARERAD